MSMKKLGLATIVLFLGLPAITAGAQEVINHGVQAQQDGNLIVYRTKGKASHSGLYYRLYVDGVNLGKLRVGRALNLSLSPGQHTLRANDRSGTQIDFLVRPNQSTVVRGEIKGNSQIQLNNVDPGEALAQMQELEEYLLATGKTHIAQQ